MIDREDSKRFQETNTFLPQRLKPTLISMALKIISAWFLHSAQKESKYILQFKTISDPLKIATKQYYCLAIEKSIPSIKSHFVSMF